MAATKSSPGLVQRARRATGFQKKYNFIFFSLFGSVLMTFVLLRLKFISINKFGSEAAPGEWYWLQAGWPKFGIRLHLSTVLPGGGLAVFQFIPAIRSKNINFHRINGDISLILLVISNIGALMVARHAFGGQIETQTLTGLLAIMTTTGAHLSYYNIKRLQIDEHRAWMLRTWFYAGSIITLRLIMILSAVTMSKLGGYYRAVPCQQIAFMHDDLDVFASKYPQCQAANGTTDDWVAVKAGFGDKPQVSVALGLNFGMAGWLALALHAIGVEIYLALTPRESERLRLVSYHRQLKAGFKNPGSAGLTVDRWGDAKPWTPPHLAGKAQAEKSEMNSAEAKLLVQSKAPQPLTECKPSDQGESVPESKASSVDGDSSMESELSAGSETSLDVENELPMEDKPNMDSKAPMEGQPPIGSEATIESNLSSSKSEKVQEQKEAPQHSHDDVD